MLLCFVVAGCGKTTNGQKTDKTKTTEKAAEKKKTEKGISFKHYKKQILEPELGVFQLGDYRYQYVFENSGESEYIDGKLDNGSGIVSTEAIDMDHDGQKEYLVFYMYGDWKDSEGHPQNCLSVKLYKKEKKHFKELDEEVILGDVMSCTDEGHWKVYIVNINGTYYICSEGYDLTYTWADGAYMSMNVCHYEDGHLTGDIDEWANGSDFTDSPAMKETSVKLNEIGLTKSADNVYKNWMYQFAAEEMGTPVIEFTGQLENPNYDNLLQYIENHEADKLPYVIGKGTVSKYKESKQKDTEQNAKEEKQEAETPEWKAVYDKILEEHKRAKANNYYNGDSEMTPNISRELCMANDPGTLFYMMVDLSGEGIPELIVATSDNNSEYHIYDIYTYDQERKQAVDIFEYELGYRMNCEICENNILKYEYSGSATDSGITYYKLGADRVVPTDVESVSYHENTADINPVGKYYHDEEGAPENEITEEQYQEIISKYPKAENLEWTALE